MSATTSALLAQARDAAARRDWPTTRDAFLAARRDGATLSADDLTALGSALWWLGDGAAAIAAHEEAHQASLAAGRAEAAALSCLEIAYTHLLRGADTIASGWLGRAQRLLDGVPECSVHGYLRFVVDVEPTLGASADDAAPLDGARELQAIGQRHDDPTLVALGIMAEGRLRLRQGEVREGMALLDEALLAIASDRLVPDWAGNIYCHLISACHEVADLRRAGDYTEALGRWLDDLPATAVFTGICRVYRADLLRIRGEWARAEREAELVCAELADEKLVTTAEAHYQIGELRRLRGDHAGAEAAYEHAHRLGRDPQPGLALLRLAQGRTDAAMASIRSALAAASDDGLARCGLCTAAVEIALAGGDLAAARQACEELERTTERYGTSGLTASHVHARGALELAGGRPADALPLLRDAQRRWQDLDARYDAARVRILLGRTYRELGDEDAARREFETAAAAFEELGAAPDASHARALTGRASYPDGLTAREVEVLDLVASGASNRDIATTLVISEKTVARHLSNIFTKLGVTSRTEAAAYAFRHGLVRTDGHPTGPARG